MAQVAVQHSTPLRSENPGSLITNESGNIHVNQVYASVVEGQASEDSRPPATLPSVPMQMQTTQAGLPQSQYAIPRSQSMPLPAPNQVATNGDLLGPVSKLESIKKWSISTYKCTKQIISERLGKSTRTVDTELETQIDYLRETQRKYLNLLRLARALASHFQQVVNTQHGLGEAMADLAQKSPELQNEFLYNAETQRNLSRNGEVLLSALNFFVSSVNTLCNKTIEDTLLTVKRYETARVEYDAYRCDLEVLTQAPRSEVSSIALEEAQRKFDVHKSEFEKLRSDVSIKLQFLNENRVKVMHKQLLLFHNAISAYFSGNQTALDATLKQFNIKLKAPNAAGPSWIEQ